MPRQAERLGARLLETDFPGLGVSAVVVCPGCNGKDSPKSHWPFRGFAPVTCEQCQEKLSLTHEPKTTVPPQPLTDPFADITLPTDGYDRGACNERLVLPYVRFGEPLEKSQRLMKALGISDRKRIKARRATPRRAPPPVSPPVAPTLTPTLTQPHTPIPRATEITRASASTPPRSLFPTQPPTHFHTSPTHPTSSSQPLAAAAAGAARRG